MERFELLLLHCCFVPTKLHNSITIQFGNSPMDAKRIHEDITHLLYKVEEQYGRIIHFKDSIPLIEVDLALKDVRDLYESFLDLRTAAELKRRKSASELVTSRVEEPVAEKIEKPSFVETKVQEIEVESPKEEVIAEVTSEKEGAAIELKLDETVEELPKNVESIKIDEDLAVAEKNAEDESSIKEPVETPAVAKAQEEPAKEAVVPPVSPKKDLLQERQKDFVPTVRKIEFKPEPVANEPKKESIFEKAASLYDKIAKPTEKTVASQAIKQPISNIKNAIGINEKFAYLKDLFKNNINEYNAALDKLNNFENYEEAEDFFQELKNKYNWDPESKAFQGLAELLNRRYLHNA